MPNKDPPLLEQRADSDRSSRNEMEVTIAEPEEKVAPPPRGGGLRRLMRQAAPERCLLIGGTVCLFLSAVFNLALPAFVGTIIDAISVPNPESSPTVGPLTKLLLEWQLASDQRSLLTAAIVGMVSCVAVGAIFSFIRGYVFNLAGERVVARLRKQLFEAIISQEIAFFDVTRTGELTNRLSADTTLLKDACTTNISMGLRWGSTVVGGIIYLFFISVKLTGVMLAVLPVVAISARIFGRKIRELSKQTQEQLARATEVAEESISNIRDVRAFSKEFFQLDLYSEKIQETYRLGAKMAFLYGAFIAFIGLVGSGAIMLVLWYGAVLVIDGEMSTGVLTSYVLYSLTVAASFAGLSGLAGDLFKAIGAVEKVFQLIDRKPAINVKGGKIIEHFTGLVQLRGVSFSYPARPDVEVLHNINLDLQPGTVTALVGPSGGGKSTIVALIERFYDLELTKGEILVDGQDIRGMDPAWLHRVVGLVKQEPILFATSIKRNLMYGVDRCTDEEMFNAARVASAHDFIEGFPEKYETVVGERGVRLSGGQKQRVAIARAVLTNPKVLIADEATSSLDAESEHKVQQALDVLMQGRTVLTIAHRLSTVKNAHNVVVVQGGTIVEQGTHAELLAREGAYARLVRRQLTDNSVSLDNDKLEF